MTKPTILAATWGDGLFAVTGDGRTQEIANQPVRGLARDGRGGALAIVGRHSLRRRAPSGEWATVATSEFELSCCMAVRDAICVGTDDARMLRLSHEGGVLDPIDGFDNVAGRDAWFAGSAIVNGQRLRPKLIYAARTRNGFTPASRADLFKKTQPFGDSGVSVREPTGEEGRAGLTAAKMAERRGLTPQLVGQFEFVERTEDAHLRHSRFVVLRDDGKAKDVRRE